jgi:prevent-host-death family protein
MVMRAIRIAELKAKLSEHLRSVRRGNVLTVLDRETPVARIVPYASDGSTLVVRRPALGSAPLSRIRFPPRLKSGQDVVALLLEDRLRNR